MKLKLLTMAVGLMLIPFVAQAAETGFLEGVAQEVIVKVRTSDGTLKWYQVKSDGSRKELEMKPGDRFEFLYDDAVDIDAITVNPKN